MTAPDKKQMRSAARLFAVQALFQMEVSGQTVERIVREFETHRFGEVLEGTFFVSKVKLFPRVLLLRMLHASNRQNSVNSTKQSQGGLTFVDWSRTRFGPLADCSVKDILSAQQTDIPESSRLTKFQ